MKLGLRDERSDPLSRFDNFRNWQRVRRGRLKVIFGGNWVKQMLVWHNWDAWDTIKHRRRFNNPVDMRWNLEERDRRWNCSNRPCREQQRRQK